MSSASALNGSIMAMLAIALLFEFEDEAVGTSERTADESPVIEAGEQTTDDERNS